MLINVRLFAMLRERAGCDSFELTLDDGATVRDALDAAGRQHDLGELIERMPVVAAVNREYAPEGSTLADGDEVALIPPVSGGEADGLAHFRSGDGYESFMELIGNQMPGGPPAYGSFLGMRPLHAEPGHVRMEFQASDQMVSPLGTVQGGFITAMLDDTMGPAGITALGPGHVVPTLELKVSFHRPLHPGRVVADGRVVHKGRSIIFLEGALRNGDGELVASATATARVVRLGKK
jgi:molybdopterin converting factor subunit 1